MCLRTTAEMVDSPKSLSIKKRIAHVDSPISKSMCRSAADSQWPSPTFFFSILSLSLLFFAIAQCQRLHGRKTIREQFSGSINLSQQLLAPESRSPFR
jgi:hypothetical protein